MGAIVDSRPRAPKTANTMAARIDTIETKIVIGTPPRMNGPQSAMKAASVLPLEASAR